jgi:hypothetical protein
MRGHIDMARRICDLTVVTEREYKRLRQKIEDEYRLDLEALDRTWELFRRNASVKAVEPVESPAKRGEVDDLVRRVVPHIFGEFTPREVKAQIMSLPDAPARVDRSSISSALRRLSEGEDKLLEVAHQGKGKRPSRYRKVGSPISSGVAAMVDEHLTDEEDEDDDAPS